MYKLSVEQDSGHPGRAWQSIQPSHGADAMRRDNASDARGRSTSGAQRTAHAIVPSADGYIKRRVVRGPAPQGKATTC